MAPLPGTYTLTPENGTLSVRTKRGGAAARAGHDLLIEVGSWTGTLQLGADAAASSVALDADASSLRVVEGTGGMTKLGEDDKQGITQTIDEDVLRGTAIAFRSTQVRGDDGVLTVSGELELLGRTASLTFELNVGDDGHVTGEATVRQTAWGIKPYSALFGTLKVADDVVVAVDAQLPEG